MAQEIKSIKILNKILKIVFLSILLFTISARIISAKSSYVLPYPSSMPGSPLYKINLIKEEVLRYWYFGQYGRFKYNLKQSDKYLVESKILFEYGQFLLGQRALKQSDKYFNAIRTNLNNSDIEKRGANLKLSLLKEASLKHIEVLFALEQEIPGTFIWQPEKSPKTFLYLKKDIEHSISIRSKNL